MIKVNVRRDPALVEGACLRVRTTRREVYVWREGARLRWLWTEPEGLTP